MKERAGLLSAGMCLFWIALRLGNAEIFARFDWIALALTALAVAGLWMPVLGAHANAPGFPSVPPTSILTTEQLRQLFASLHSLQWPTERGGVYDALHQLSQTQPFTAVCASRGMIATMLRQLGGDVTALAVQQKISPEDEAALKQLIAALDALAASGEGHPDAQTLSRRLLPAALSAMARLEHISG